MRYVCRPSLKPWLLSTELEPFQGIRTSQGKVESVSGLVVKCCSEAVRRNILASQVLFVRGDNDALRSPLCESLGMFPGHSRGPSLGLNLFQLGVVIDQLGRQDMSDISSLERGLNSLGKTLNHLVELEVTSLVDLPCDNVSVFWLWLRKNY